MTPLKHFLIAATIVASTFSFGYLAQPHQALAAQVSYVVNKVPITSYDIKRRAAFLKLQRQKGNLRTKAKDEMIDQTLKVGEMNRLGIKVPKSDINKAFANFASSNGMTSKQLAMVLNQAGVGEKHFKQFIGVQIGWGSAVRARFQAEGRMSEQDVAKRLRDNGGKKPSTTEYMLQQVIFVIPDRERKAIMKRRKREANAMRKRFSNCDSTRGQAKGIIDVTVRNLGKVLEPELPIDWSKLIKGKHAGQTTKIRETPRGVEYIAICSTRKISDDRVAQMIFTNEGDLDAKGEEFSQKYIKELRKNAKIVKR